jgi:hypothetical protein
LVTDQGQLHPSSKKINTFQKSDVMVEKFASILRTEVKDVPMFLCAPIYRDAVVFYGHSGQRISVLNVCLSCQYMETAMFYHITADYETYNLLERFFMDAGHNL